MGLIRRKLKRFYHKGLYTQTPVGLWGKTTLQGEIRPQRRGEVAIKMGGGLQFYYAEHADGATVPSDTEVLVVEQVGPRSVKVITKEEAYT